MGCGGHSKETDDTVKKQATTTPRRFGSRLLPDPRNKLAPEVLEGFTRLIKSFYFCDSATAPAKSSNMLPVTNTTLTANGGKGGTGAFTGLTTDHGRTEAAGGKSLPSVSGGEAANPGIAPEPKLEDTKAQAKAVPSSFQAILASEQQKGEAPSLGNKGREQGGGGIEESEAMREGGEEHRYSPEPPRPEALSDDEEGPYEDPSIRAARLEKERLAKEEAERRAAELRLEEETSAAQRKGAMNNMQSEADSILSKYQ